jgi:hypothetical protein
MPVERRPDDERRLRDATVVLDRERKEGVFWGVLWEGGVVDPETRAELYVFGLHEQDSAQTATRDRRLVTPGARIVRAPAPGALDFEIESALQLGTSRATRDSGNTRDLDHRAWFGHGSLGYTIDTVWSPRLVLQYDYASGDADPDDDANGRFDTLYGARRFEFGPTGIYGAFARSNISSPALRVQVRPSTRIDAFAAYRPVWLAQARDAWTTSGVHDPSGAAGRFVGHQLEARVRWQLLPGNMLLDAGFANLWCGRFARTAPIRNVAGDGEAVSRPTYVYAQLLFEI